MVKAIIGRNKFSISKEIEFEKEMSNKLKEVYNEWKKHNYPFDLDFKEGMEDKTEKEMKEEFVNSVKLVISTKDWKVKEPTKSREGNITAKLMFQKRNHNETIDWGEYQNDYHYENIIKMGLTMANEYGYSPVAVFVYINGDLDRMVFHPNTGVGNKTNGKI